MTPPAPLLVFRGPVVPDAVMKRMEAWRPTPGCNVYVKPLVINQDDYGVFELTPWEDVWDDLRRYGLWVALYNVFWHVWHYWHD